MRSPRLALCLALLPMLVGLLVTDATGQEKRRRPEPIPITVTVIDADDDKPEPGVRVHIGNWVRGRGEVTRARGVSDENGRVTLKMHPGNRPWVHGFGRPSPDSQRSCLLIEEPIRVSAKRSDVTVTLPRHIEFSGVVRDLAGKPVAAAAIHFVMGTGAADHELESPVLAAAPPHEFELIPDRTAYVARAISGPCGLFSCRIRVTNTGEMVSLFGGRLLATSLHAAAFTPDLMSSLWIKLGAIPKGKTRAQPTQITCFPPANLTVRLIDHQGRPIANEHVEVEELQCESLTRMSRLPTALGRAWGQLHFRGATDANGHAKFVVPAGVNLRVTAPRLALMSVGDQVCVGGRLFGGRPARVGGPLRLAAGEAREFVVRQPRLVRVHGRVLGADGKPIAGVWVSAGHRRTSAETDAEGRYRLPAPVPLGAPLQVSPPKGNRIHSRELPTETDGNEIDYTIRVPDGVTVRVDRADVREVQLGSGAGPTFPDAETKVETGRAFRFNWASPREVVVIPAPNPPVDPVRPGRLGFCVLTDVDTSSGEARVAYREPEFDANLTVRITPRQGKSVEGVVYLACVGVEKHATVGVFGELEAAASESVRFPALQAGTYLLGFIPAKGKTRRLREPGEPRPARFPRGYEHASYWKRRFGIRAAARRNAHWRTLRVRPGDNTVDLDLAASTRGGVLEIVATDRSGTVLPEFGATLSTEENPAVTARLTGRHTFVADDRGVIRIEGVRPGLYELHIGRGHIWSDPYTEIPTAIPSSGTHRIRIAFDVEASPATELPPLVPDPALAMKPAQLRDATTYLKLREVVALFIDGERAVARQEITKLVRKQPRDGMAAAALAAMIDGVGGPSRPGTAKVDPGPEDYVVNLGAGLGCDAEMAELIGLKPGADGSFAVTDALDLLWKRCEASRVWGRSQEFRWWAATQRLHQLYRHHGRRGERLDEIRRLLGFLARDGALNPEQAPLELGEFVAALRRRLATGPGTVKFETEHLRIVIDGRGHLTALTDRATDHDYLHAATPAPLLAVRVEGRMLRPERMERDAKTGCLVLTYAEDAITARVRTAARPTHVTFELVSIESKRPVDLVLWGPYPTTIRGTVGETVGVVRSNTFAFGIQALNVKTLGGYPGGESDVMPQYSIFAGSDYTDIAESDRKKVLFRGDTARPTKYGSVVQAFCRDRSRDRVIPNWQHEKFVAPAYDDAGVKGSKIALFGCPTARALAVIGKIEVAEGLPHPTIDGVWAKISPDANRSYLIAPFTEETLDEALTVTRRAGLRYLYHGAPFASWGHFGLRKKAFPRGWDGLRDCVQRAEKQGIRLGVHTLSNFINTNDPYVTPVPDPRLAKVGSSVLTEAIDAKRTELPVKERIWFDQMKNNTLKTVMLDEELVQYDRVSAEKPWRLLGCRRGAFGTRAAAHPAGRAVAKLIDHPYKVFLGNAELSREMAERIADLFNHTGLRQISFDGLEGNWSTGLGQYGRTLFVKAWYDRLTPELRGRVINDASNPGHYFWHIYTRMNWGEPWYAGFRQSQTGLRLKNQEFFRRNLMPAMLGWFKLTATTPLEDVEWLLARAAGYDAGFCLHTSLEAVRANKEADAIFAAVTEWEAARHAGAFSAAQKKRLRDIHREFRLTRTGDARWELRPVRVVTEKVKGPDGDVTEVTRRVAGEPEPVAASK